VFEGTSKPPAINTVPVFLSQMPRNSFGGYVSGWALRSVTRADADADLSEVLFEVKGRHPSRAW